MSARSGVGMTSERTRMRMIELVRREGVTNEKVLGAMAEVPRHLFVDEGIASRAYEDVPLPIGSPSSELIGVTPPAVVTAINSSAS